MTSPVPGRRVLAPAARGRWLLAALLPGVVLQVGWLEPARASSLAVAIGVAVVVDVAARRLRRTVHSDDHGALVAAVLVALLAPAATPLPLLAGALAIALVAARHVFGGVGQAVFHPAMVALALLMLLPPTAGAAQPAPAEREWLLALAWLAGGVLLLARRRLRWQAPLGFLLAVAAGAVAQAFASSMSLVQAPMPLMASATWLIVFFVITDPVCAATTPRARLAYGAGVGLLAMALRGDAAPTAVIAPAVLLMNLAAPALDRWLAPARARPA